MLGPVYRAVAWQGVDQIRYSIFLHEEINLPEKCNYGGKSFSSSLVIVKKYFALNKALKGRCTKFTTI
jgi:hypothetical protein